MEPPPVVSLDLTPPPRRCPQCHRCTAFLTTHSTTLLRTVLCFLLLFLLLSTAIVFYALWFALPSCGMSNVPSTPLPLPFILRGFGPPLPNLFTHFHTVKTVLQQPTQTLQEGWDRLQHTKQSWHTLGWLTQDYTDALRHLVFFTTPASLRKRRKARAVRSLQLYELEDTAGKDPTTQHTAQDHADDATAYLNKWSTRKLINYFRKRLNQVEQVESTTTTTTRLPPTLRQWLHRAKQVKDKKKLMLWVHRIKVADVCLQDMPWWSLPLVNPDGNGRGVRCVNCFVVALFGGTVWMMLYILLVLCWYCVGTGVGTVLLLSCGYSLVDPLLILCLPIALLFENQHTTNITLESRTHPPSISCCIFRSFRPLAES